MPFTTDAQILIDLAAILKFPDSATLLTKGLYWINVVALTHVVAYARIVQTLALHGYTAAQIAGWDNGAAYERTIAAGDALVYNAALSKADDKFITRYDTMTKELDTLILVISGVATYPAGPVGTVHVGSIRGHDHHHFDWEG